VTTAAAPNPYPTLARFNRWVNGRHYECCARLSDGERKRDRHAYFGSIHNTLNHLLVVDRLWLNRMEGKPNGIAALDQILFADFEEMRRARAAEDDRLVALVDGRDEAALAGEVAYRFTSGAPAATPLHQILMTLFNHQTHHRGQVHAMLTQAGIRPPDCDVIDFLEESRAQ
jgi:uncharacterized damage-inducible protein DinB